MVDSIGAKPVTAIDRRIAPVAAVTTTQPARPVASGGDTAAVSLTSIARELSQTPPVDVDRVARIRKAIADGTFPIFPAKIADRLIALKLQWNPHDAA